MLRLGLGKQLGKRGGGRSYSNLRSAIDSDFREAEKTLVRRRIIRSPYTRPCLVNQVITSGK
jgi:hypothetical protein